jgi:7,8-dihydro-6-hydroxymethylpterin-pyrophosphokinase
MDNLTDNLTDKLTYKLNNNISFFLDEKDDNNDNDEEIKKMMEEFTILSDSDVQETDLWSYTNQLDYLNNELLYETEYTVKDLLKICSYYGIDKNIKISKCKKRDIIDTIVYFESSVENLNIVQKRIMMWKYINALLNDPKMKKFIIWN